MADDVVIRAEGLGKKYVIGHQSAERYTALRDVMARAAKNFARTTRDMLRGKALVAGDETEDFWALKDVSFDIKRGDVVGIIGRNGAGKSTLLKVLSRITEPTEGRVTIKGRVASLLEVGTGFHPELTGRENIYLNGAILGMGRAEIRAKFDEIVAFAEVERFLDTPVKRYSSGMYVRLAFAVAAHLEPEILIVDEVLAVGDARFQDKCLGKMQTVADAGRTVLFVSHDIRRITTLCGKAMLLADGHLKMVGDISAVTSAFLNRDSEPTASANVSARFDRSGNGDARFCNIELFSDSKSTNTLQFGAKTEICIRLQAERPVQSLQIQARIVNVDRIGIQEFYSVNDGINWSIEPGQSDALISIDHLLLYPGKYAIDLWMGAPLTGRIDYITDAIYFSVIQTNREMCSSPLDSANAFVFQPAQWSLGSLSP